MPKTLGVISRSNANSHWFRVNPYGPNDIRNIPDPEGDTDKKRITSIPSPFARVDLFKTAFKYIVEEAETSGGGNTLDGNTIHHRLVSYCLDLAQLFFNLDIYQEDTSKQIQVITWERNKHLDGLINSGNPKHKVLGETLQLFLEQDKEAYNFDRWQSIYLLSYNYKIIGGTSPSTLFFTTANSLDFVDIKVGNHQFFRNSYQPLYKREFEFQKYLHLLFKVHARDLHQPMKEFMEYLTLNLKELASAGPEKHREIQTALSTTQEPEFKKQYFELNTGTAGQIIQVIGVPLRKKVVDKSTTQGASDFVIASEKFSRLNPDNLKPLVLQNNFNKQGFNYVKGGIWEQNTPVPYRDDKPMDKRKLPNQNMLYPYLTVDDFLEPYLIKMLYPMNSSAYFDGNRKGFDANDPGYLIPVKKTFTQFFDISFLKGSIQGYPVFELEKRAMGGVAATLRIPIEKGGEFITFERLYYPGVSSQEIPKPNISEFSNDGAILDSQFGLALAPFIKMPPQYKSHYRVVTVDRDVLPISMTLDYKLQFFQHDKGDTPLVDVIEKKRSDKQAREGATSKFYVLDQGFDFIEVNNSLASGLILPDWEQKVYTGGSNKFSFAVDFGTTNSHIEYHEGSQGRSLPKPFEVSADDIQFRTTFPTNYYFDIASEIPEIILQEFLPEIIGKGSEFKFPTRTTVSEHHKLNHFQAVYALADVNVPYYFEKYKERGNIRINSDLKWSNFTQEAEDQNRVEMFIENLMFLIRNKILFNQGDLNRTELVWFYPSSMTPMRKDKLKRLWEKTFEKYITALKEESNTSGGFSTNIRELSESLAPYYYYRSAMGVSSSAAPVISIDIGGGTTDVVAFYENKPEFLTSFRFAGNAIFGDAFNGSPNTNGFVRKFTPKVRNILEQNAMSQLLMILDDMPQRSSDIISFFFSLENNKGITDKNIKLSFSEMLSDDEDLKIVFLVFYGAIIYHIAKLMKKDGLAMPRYICFGGNGSKIINVVDGSGSKLVRLTRLSKLIFEKVYEQKYGQESPTEDLTLRQVIEPKELTCKGGLSDSADAEIDD
ncbi:MAG: hypothetical protein AAFV80_13615, partial [Bacteroidota bacterium]